MYPIEYGMNGIHNWLTGHTKRYDILEEITEDIFHVVSCNLLISFFFLFLKVLFDAQQFINITYRSVQN